MLLAAVATAAYDVLSGFLGGSPDSQLVIRLSIESTLEQRPDTICISFSMSEELGWGEGMLEENILFGGGACRNSVLLCGGLRKDGKAKG